MSRYNALKHFLSSKSENNWTISFQEIESILGSRLPKSAYQYSAWWANNVSETTRHCRSWLDAGWQATNVNLTDRQVTFVRGSSENFLSSQKSKAVKLNESRRGITVPSWMQGHSSECHASYTWVAAGMILLNETDKKLVFDVDVSAQAGLYKFHIRHKDKQSVYIGESQNLRRRFQNYRTPGPTQKTSLRLNSIIITALQNKAEVAVYISTHALLNKEVADFSQKPIRRLVESMEIVENALQNTFEILNL